jgi:hypothetical protein
VRPYLKNKTRAEALTSKSITTKTNKQNPQKRVGGLHSSSGHPVQGPGFNPHTAKQKGRLNLASQGDTALEVTTQPGLDGMTLS